MLAPRGITLTLLVCALGLGLTQLSHAQDKKVDVNGTWKWTQDGFGQPVEYTLKLKQEGEKITGTLSGGFDNSDVAISEGKLKDNEVTFKTTRDFGGGGPITTLYTLKIDGDSVKGKSELVIVQNFDAKRSK